MLVGKFRETSLCGVSLGFYQCDAVSLKFDTSSSRLSLELNLRNCSRAG